jgi:nucleoside-diphosphate-sugar epimerase
MRLLVSGASGFVGSALLRKLAGPLHHELIGIYRNPAAVRRDSAPHAALIGNLDAKQDWSGIPRSSDALIHAAARVHLLADRAADPLAEYRKTNVDGTLNLARQAAAAGLRRFVFISTIKVNGECTVAREVFSASDAPAPSDPYGVSKWEAEQGLREIASRTGMEVVVIRPPLVYGPGVKGNFRSMLQWLKRGWPLPFGALRNLRSLVYLDNLIDLIVTTIDHPAAANRTFLVSDGEDLSTPDLLRRTAHALGRPAHLIAVPSPLLTAGAAVVGKKPAMMRLCDSLRVDMAATCRLLDWSPATPVDSGLAKTAESFLLETSH